MVQGAKKITAPGRLKNKEKRRLLLGLGGENIFISSWPNFLHDLDVVPSFCLIQRDSQIAS